MTENGSTPTGSQRTPVHLWIVGILAFLWEGMGAFDYLATQLRLDFYMSQFPPEQLAYFYGLPAWEVAAWAIAVWSGVAGAIGLLVRKSWAVWMFALSLVGLAVSTLYNFGLSNGAEIMGTAGIVFTVVIWVVGILLLLYARWLTRRGILR